MLCDPLAHLLGDGLDGAVAEGHLQTSGLAQLGVAGSTGAADEAQIALPCVLLVVEAQQEELQCGHGGQAVVDIVEGALVDVELTLPARTAAIEGQIVEVDPGAVLVLQLQPSLVALVGGEVGVLIHDVLELIHCAAVGEEEEAVLGVEQGVLVRILAEEQVMPRRGEELHRHRVDLGALHAGALEVGGDLGVALGDIALEGVAALVGQHVYVSRGVVPVGEDEGRLVRGQTGHIAAGHLAGTALDVEQLVVLHEVDELRRLGAEFVVHGAGSGHPGIVALDGLGVAVPEGEGQVGEGGVLDAGALVLEGDDFLQLRHDVMGHLLAEALDVLGAVADAVHPHIGKLAVVVIAHDLSLLVQVLDDLRVQLVQLGAVGVEVAGLGLIGGAAGGGIGALLVGAELGDGKLSAVELHQRTAVDLLIGADEGVVLLLQRYGALVHAEHSVLHASHAGGAEGLGQGIYMGVGKESAADLDAGVGHSRAVGVKEILFGLPVGVAGVAGVVDIGEVRSGSVVGKSAALLVIGLHKGLAAVGGCGFCRQLLAAGQQCVDVGAGIGHLTEFHRENPFRDRKVPFNSKPILSRLGRKRKALDICDKFKGFVLVNLLHPMIETERKKAYNSSINRVRPCASSAASTGSCAADEGRPAVHGLHPAAAWTWVRARPSARRRPEVKFVELTPSFVRFVTGEGVSFCPPASS